MTFLRLSPFEQDKFPQLGQIMDQFGFIPNFYKAQTLRPDLIDAEIGLVQSILIADGALSRRQKEYIFLVCSAANLSTYCVTAHCEIVRMLKLTRPEPEAVAADHNKTDLPMTDKALLNFALKLNNDPTKVKARDIEGLRTYGFTEPQILEAVMAVGLAKYANFVAFGLGTVPDFEPVTLAPRGH